MPVLSATEQFVGNMRNNKMKHSLASIIRWISPLLLAVVFGCGQGNPLGRQAVNGQVTLDGAPLDQGTVSFSPESKGSVGGGATVKNGEFSIPAAQGLPPGKYVVRINSTVRNPAAKAKLSSVPTPNDAAGPGIERVAPAFNRASKILVEVVAGHSAEFSFAAKSK